jgi:hypothetical protein
MKRNQVDKHAVNLGRHQKICKVCRHEKRAEIEQDFTSWGSINRISKDYNLTRDSIYRHAHALGLFPKRQQNVKKALERIIERAEDVEVTASAVVQAIQAYSKINAEGRWIERSETVNLNELFDRMTNQELESYAQTGVLPDWFPVVATTGSGPDEEDNG